LPNALRVLETAVPDFGFPLAGGSAVCDVASESSGLSRGASSSNVRPRNWRNNLLPICPEWTLWMMVAREGIEPPTRGFSARCRVFQGFINQSLAASCRPLPRHTKAQSWHTQSELVTFLAQRLAAARPALSSNRTKGCINLGPMTRESLAVDDRLSESVARCLNAESVRTLKAERCSAAVR